MEPCDYYENGICNEMSTNRNYKEIIYILEFMFRFNDYGDMVCLYETNIRNTIYHQCYKNKGIINKLRFNDALKVIKINEI